MAGWVQTVATHGSTSAGSSDTIAVGAAVPVDDHLIIAGAAGGAKLISSVSDTKGNTYQVDASGTNGTGNGLTIVSAHITTALTTSDTITITWSGSNATRSVAIEQYTGLDTTSWLDKVGAAAGATSTAPLSGTTATTAQANELLFGAFEMGGNLTRPVFSAGTGNGTFTKRSQATSNNGTNTGRDVATEDQVVAATGTYFADGSLSISDPWIALLCTYKIAAGGPTTFTQSITVSAGSTASAVKAAALIRSFTASSSPSIVKQAGLIKTFTAASAATLASARAYMVTIAATVGNSVARALQAEKPITVTGSSTLTIKKDAARTLIFTAATAPGLVKSVTKSLVATVGNAVTIGVARFFNIAITATASSTATRSLTVGKPISTSVGSAASMVKAVAKVLPFVGSTSVTDQKQVSKPLSMTAGSTVTFQKSVGKLFTFSVGNFVDIIQGGAITYFVEIAIAGTVNASTIIQPQLVTVLNLFTSNAPSMSIAKRVAKTITATSNSVLTLLRGIYYPGSDPANQTFTGLSINDVSISHGANGVEFATSSENNVLIEVSDNSITVTEG